MTCLADFFLEDDIFIAYGKERMSVDDFYIVTEGFFYISFFFVLMLVNLFCCSFNASSFLF